MQSPIQRIVKAVVTPQNVSSAALWGGTAVVTALFVVQVSVMGVEHWKVYVSVRT